MIKKLDPETVVNWAFAGLLVLTVVSMLLAMFMVDMLVFGGGSG